MQYLPSVKVSSKLSFDLQEDAATEEEKEAYRMLENTLPHSLRDGNRPLSHLDILKTADAYTKLLTICKPKNESKRNEILKVGLELIRDNILTNWKADLIMDLSTILNEIKSVTPRLSTINVQKEEGRPQTALSIQKGERLTAHGVQEEELSTALSVQGGEPLTALSVQGGEPLTALSLQKGERLTAHGVQEGEPLTAPSVQKGERLTAFSVQAREPSKALSFLEGEPSKALSLQEGEPSTVLRVHEGEYLKTLSVQEGEYLTALSVQEDKSSIPLGVQEGEPPKAPRVQETEPPTALSDREGEPLKALGVQEGEHPTALGVQEGEHPTVPSVQEGEHPKAPSVREGEHPTALSVREGEHPTALGVQEGEHPTALGDQEGEHPTAPSVQEGEDPTVPSVREGEQPKAPSVWEGEHPRALGVQEGEHPTALGVQKGEHPKALGVHEGEHPKALGVHEGEHPTAPSVLEREPSTALRVLEGEQLTALGVQEGEHPKAPSAQEVEFPTAPSVQERELPTATSALEGEPQTALNIPEEKPITILSNQNMETQSITDTNLAKHAKSASKVESQSDLLQTTGVENVEGYVTVSTISPMKSHAVTLLSCISHSMDSKPVYSDISDAEEDGVLTGRECPSQEKKHELLTLPELPWLAPSTSVDSQKIHNGICEGNFDVISASKLPPSIILNPIELQPETELPLPFSSPSLVPTEDQANCSAIKINDIAKRKLSSPTINQMELQTISELCLPLDSHSVDSAEILAYGSDNNGDSIVRRRLSARRVSSPVFSHVELQTISELSLFTPSSESMGIQANESTTKINGLSKRRASTSILTRRKLQTISDLSSADSLAIHPNIPAAKGECINKRTMSSQFLNPLESQAISKLSLPIGLLSKDSKIIDSEKPVIEGGVIEKRRISTPILSEMESQSLLKLALSLASPLVNPNEFTGDMQSGDSQTINSVGAIGNKIISTTNLGQREFQALSDLSLSLDSPSKDVGIPQTDNSVIERESISTERAFSPLVSLDDIFVRNEQGDMSGKEELNFSGPSSMKKANMSVPFGVYPDEGKEVDTEISANKENDSQTQQQTCAGGDGKLTQIGPSVINMPVISSSPAKLIESEDNGCVIKYQDIPDTLTSSPVSNPLEIIAENEPQCYKDGRSLLLNVPSPMELAYLSADAVDSHPGYSKEIHLDEASVIESEDITMIKVLPPISKPIESQAQSEMSLPIGLPSSNRIGFHVDVPGSSNNDPILCQTEDVNENQMKIVAHDDEHFNKTPIVAAPSSLDSRYKSETSPNRPSTLELSSNNTSKYNANTSNFHAGDSVDKKPICLISHSVNNQLQAQTLSEDSHSLDSKLQYQCRTHGKVSKDKVKGNCRKRKVTPITLPQISFHKKAQNEIVPTHSSSRIEGNRSWIDISMPHSNNNVNTNHVAYIHPNASPTTPSAAMYPNQPGGFVQDPFAMQFRGPLGFNSPTTPSAAVYPNQPGGFVQDPFAMQFRGPLGFNSSTTPSAAVYPNQPGGFVQDPFAMQFRGPQGFNSLIIHRPMAAQPQPLTQFRVISPVTPPLTLYTRPASQPLSLPAANCRTQLCFDTIPHRYIGPGSVQGQFLQPQQHLGRLPPNVYSAYPPASINMVISNCSHDPVNTRQIHSPCVRSQDGILGMRNLSNQLSNTPKFHGPYANSTLCLVDNSNVANKPSNTTGISVNVFQGIQRFTRPPVLPQNQVQGSSKMVNPSLTVQKNNPGTSKQSKRTGKGNQGTGTKHPGTCQKKTGSAASKKSPGKSKDNQGTSNKNTGSRKNNTETNKRCTGSSKNSHGTGKKNTGYCQKNSKLRNKSTGNSKNKSGTNKKTITKNPNAGTSNKKLRNSGNSLPVGQNIPGNDWSISSKTEVKSLPNVANMSTPPEPRESKPSKYFIDSGFASGVDSPCTTTFTERQRARKKTETSSTQTVDTSLQKVEETAFSLQTSLKIPEDTSHLQAYNQTTNRSLFTGNSNNNDTNMNSSFSGTHEEMIYRLHHTQHEYKSFSEELQESVSIDDLLLHEDAWGEC